METPDSSAGSTQPFSKGKRILAVDDEPNILRLIKVNLERKGYEVETAENGADALTQIKENKPDLLVTDLMMPEMDGLELIDAIRADPLLADLPILLMVVLPADYGVDLAAYWEQYTIRGASRLIVKPFSPKELVEIIDDMLSSP